MDDEEMLFQQVGMSLRPLDYVVYITNLLGQNGPERFVPLSLARSLPM